MFDYVTAALAAIVFCYTSIPGLKSNLKAKRNPKYVAEEIRDHPWVLHVSRVIYAVLSGVAPSLYVGATYTVYTVNPLTQEFAGMICFVVGTFVLKFFLPVYNYGSTYQRDVSVSNDKEISKGCAWCAWLVLLVGWGLLVTSLVFMFLLAPTAAYVLLAPVVWLTGGVVYIVIANARSVPTPTPGFQLGGMLRRVI